MNSNSKSVTSTAIKAEIKRYESLQSTINRLSKQFERVGDQQLRSGLKVYLHSIQGKLISRCCNFCFMHDGGNACITCVLQFIFWLLGRAWKLLCSISVQILPHGVCRWGNMTAKVIDIFLFTSCLSAAFFQWKHPPSSVFFCLLYIHFEATTLHLPVAFQYTRISLSGSLWTCATNHNISQQPSPWRQDETCCAAYFLSANLQLPSKPLPFRQTGPLHVKPIILHHFLLSLLPTLSC